MPDIVKQVKLNYFDFALNSNKVWIGIAYSDGTFESNYGRIVEGARLAKSVKKLGSQREAENHLAQKKNEKLGKGYVETLAVEQGDSITVAVGSQAAPKNLSALAAAQIKQDGDDTTLKLIEYLAQVNIHNITHSTSIVYNSANASFSTPLGVLKPEAILQARDLLKRIQDFNRKKDFGVARTALVGSFYRIVPKDFGRKIPAPELLLEKDSAITEQENILDALEVSMKDSADDSDDRIFKCSLKKVPHWTDEGRQLFRTIRNTYQYSKVAGHVSASLQMKRLYTVEIEDMQAKFEQASKRLGNIKQGLWHGTKASNLLSILKNGLIIPPQSAAHCTGRMFGNGIYTSLQSTKALNYATNFWNSSGPSNQRTFMFLCEAALGKEHKPKSSGSNFPAPGTNSTWVEAGTAGVMNHECIVYDTAQINLKYLVEFGS